MTFDAAFAALQAALDAPGGADRPAACGAFAAALGTPFNLLQLQKLNATVRTHAAAFGAHFGGRVVRAAILGSYTTQPIREALAAVITAGGALPEIYEGGYGSLETETLDPDAGVFAFRPDVVLLAAGWPSVHTLPEPGASAEAVAALVDSTLDVWRQRWATLEARTGAQLIQHTFDLPPERPLGRLEARVPWSTTRFFGALNDALRAAEGGRLALLDVAALAHEVGQRAWFDPRFWHHSKHGFAPARVLEYTRALGGLWRALEGRTRKALVLDLDNTLWGGVIGDDGLGGIKLGQGSAAGEAYVAFGRYVRRLRALGVVLAVNSKNDPAVARAALADHPESPLRPEDFAAFVCNWSPKSENLRAIAAQLNLGLDALVFADDNPAECAQVRQALPEVTVIELAGDPAGFPRLIEEQCLFTPLSLTAEDLLRAESYRARAAFTQAAEGAPADLPAFLRGLEMVAEVGPAPADDLPRLAQLFGKTNQFNLTGETFDEATLAAMRASAAHVVLSGRLTDRHANHGIVTAAVAHVSGEALVLDNWVMSCRVFNRGLEAVVLARLQALALAAGCTRVEGCVVATPKNDYARRFFAQAGLTADAEAGVSPFQRAVTAPPLPSFIRCP